LHPYAEIRSIHIESIWSGVPNSGGRDVRPVIGYWLTSADVKDIELTVGITRRRIANSLTHEVAVGVSSPLHARYLQFVILEIDINQRKAPGRRWSAHRNTN